MGRAPGPARKRGQRPRRAIQLPAKYSHEFPVSEGHNYLLRAIPVDVWARAVKRSQAEDRAIRVVLIRALERYAAGRLEL